MTTVIGVLCAEFLEAAVLDAELPDDDVVKNSGEWWAVALNDADSSVAIKEGPFPTNADAWEWVDKQRSLN
jgi:hypothetical protein